MINLKLFALAEFLMIMIIKDSANVNLEFSFVFQMKKGQFKSQTFCFYFGYLTIFPLHFEYENL